MEFVVIDQFTSYETVTEWFLIKLDFIILPSTLIGLPFALIGLIFSFMINDKLNKILGIIGVVTGFIVIYIGLRRSVGHMVNAFDSFSF